MSVDRWAKHAKTAAIVNNVLAVVVLLMAATMIYLYLR